MFKKLVLYISMSIMITTLSFLYSFDHGPVAEGGVSVTPNTIRIGLVREVPEMQFSVQGEYVLLNGYGGEVITKLEPHKRYTVERIDRGINNSVIKLSSDGQSIGSYSAPLVVKKVVEQINILSGSGALAKRTSGQGLSAVNAEGEIINLSEDLSQYKFITVNGMNDFQVNTKQQLVTLFGSGESKRYRGDFDFRLDEKGITIINDLPFEEYLYGIVPSEMPNHWPKEALKAQAVVARTYALYSQGQYLAYGFDILASQQNQIYHGYDQETTATNAAVQQTKGQVLTYDNRLIMAVFHSSNGGFTGNCSEVWKEEVPYLQAKKDSFDYNEKHYNWSITMTADQIAKQLTERGYPYSVVLNLAEAQRDETGARVKVMHLKGLDKNGDLKEEDVFNADRVRFALGLKSSVFNMDKHYDQNNNLQQVTFSGNGWGHGLGMSQYGARAMSLEGYTYQDILKYYYSDVELEHSYGV
ncbi:MAG: SpoIID/LytB domain-containing protein [Firmicutes bacterium]|nr:SpoIID/LytB domain-containing protein [Bacillota bacterium]